VRSKHVHNNLLKTPSKQQYKNPCPEILPHSQN
jgi:hypothetical protein